MKRKLQISQHSLHEPTQSYSPVILSTPGHPAVLHSPPSTAPEAPDASTLAMLKHAPDRINPPTKTPGSRLHISEEICMCFDIPRSHAKPAQILEKIARPGWYSPSRTGRNVPPSKSNFLHHPSPQTFFDLP